jgi:dihydrofolate reductase
MGKLIYSAIASLDGYTADREGNFDWAAPDAEVHAFVNDLERTIGTYLYGRRMYETMVYWETVPLATDEPIERDYTEIWRAADKVVYSRTLDAVSSERTRLERSFDPDTIAQMKATTESDIGIGGPNLAAHAIRAGLVDEIHLFLTPIVIGSGTAALPDDARVELALLDDRRFANGTVYLRYRTRSPGA